MANTPKTTFLRQRPQGQDAHDILDFKAARLTGDLKAGTVILAGASAEEVINIAGLLRVRTTYQLTGTALDETVQIIPMLADGTTEKTVDIVSDSGATTATQRGLDFEAWGEDSVKVKITNNHGSNSLTVDLVELSGR